MLELGWNYRIDEISCALGLSQISRSKGISKRRSLVKTYKKLLKNKIILKFQNLRVMKISCLVFIFSIYRLS